MREAVRRRRGNGLGDPEIGDDGFAVVHHHVLRFDVAMDDLLAVRVVERRRDGPRDLHGVFYRKAVLSLEALPQRLAFDERHDVVQQIVGAAGIVHRHDVRVLQPAGDLDLAQESLRAQALGQVRVQDLDGDGAVVPGVVRTVHRCHAATSDLALDFVVPAERGVQLGDRIHCRRTRHRRRELRRGLGPRRGQREGRP